MKPDTFDFKSLPAFLLQLYPFHHPHMLLNEKKKNHPENALCQKKFKMK